MNLGKLINPLMDRMGAVTELIEEIRDHLKFQTEAQTKILEELEKINAHLKKNGKDS